ncbi:MAG: lactate utilization protein [Anaerolineae bacterium]|nr:lactate utilization protein [Anaerolineae bacterium]
MTSRDLILNQLKEHAQVVAMPAPWVSHRDFADLADQFEQALTAVHGEVIRTDGLDEAVSALAELLTGLGVKTAVANSEPPLDSLDLPTAFPSIQWHIVEQTAGNLREFCVFADVGISSGDAGLAETGSVIISSGPGKSRLATLLPPVHIAILPTSKLTSDLFTWTAARQTATPSNITLVSGPSKTADIEQTMAIGVHGPKRFIVILYEA